MATVLIALCLAPDGMPIAATAEPPLDTPPADEPTPPTPAPSEAAVADLDRVYNEALPSVFLVETENWTSVGFLADPSGLIVTAPRSIQPCRYLTVTVAPGRRFAARAVDASASPYEVIRVHPEAVAGLRTLPIAGRLEDTRPPARGDPLVAIFQSPEGGFVEKTGTVTEDEDQRLRVDLTLLGGTGHTAVPEGCWSEANEFFAPAVVLDSEGRVIGLNPFVGGLSQAKKWIARFPESTEFLAKARAEARKTSPPSGALLPVVPTVPYPPEALQRLAAAGPNLGPYQAHAGPFLVEFLTPPLARAGDTPQTGEMEEQQGREAEAGREALCSQPKGARHRWRPAFTDESPVVTVRVIPEIHRRTGIYAGVTVFWILSPLIFVGSFLGGHPVTAKDVPHVSHRLEPSVSEVELRRKGMQVEPIRSERFCWLSGCLLNVDLCPLAGEERRKERRRLKGCYLTSSYPASAFAPGEPMELLIYGERGKNSKPLIVRLDDGLLQRISSDFQPYFEVTSGN